MSEQVKCDKCGLTTGPYDRECWIRCESTFDDTIRSTIPATVDFCSIDCAASYFRNRLIDNRSPIPSVPTDEEPF